MIEPAVGDADPDVAALAGEVVATLDGLGGGPRTEVEASFGQVCGQVTRLLRALLERRPLAMVVDDLHTLDEDALALLAIVLRRLSHGRIALVAASRLAHPSGTAGLDALLGRLEGDGVLTVLALRPLADEWIGALVSPVLAADAPDGTEALVRDIAARAEGNPFFALQMAAAAVDRPDVAPMTRQAAVLQRFVPLDPAARTAARAIAALGSVDVADLGLLAEVTDLPEADVAVAFDDLVSAGVLRRAGDVFAFTHDVVRDAVLADLGPAGRHRLHRRIADGLLARRASGRPADLLALASHLSAAAEPGDLEAVGVLIAAGDRTRALAPGTAASMYARAIELAPAESAERTTALARRCRALAIATEAAAAVESGRLALAGLPPGNPERARTAVSVIGALFELGRVEEALAVADAELDERPDAVIAAQRPMLLWFSGRFDEALLEWRRVRALELATDAERILVLGQLAMGAATFYEHDELLDIVSSLDALAEGAPPTLRLYAIAIAAYTASSNAFTNRALPLLQQAESLLEDAGGTPFRGNILVARVTMDWLQGRWDEALDAAAAAADELEGAQLAIHLGAFRAAEIDIRAQRGEQVDPRVLAFEPPTRNHADLKAFSVAGMHAAAGNLDLARDVIAATRARSGAGTAYLPLLLGQLVELELACGDRPAAETAMAELEKVSTTMRDPWMASWLGRSRALIGGDPSDAAQAADAADAAGMPFERARSLLVQAELDPAAVDAATEAHRVFQSLRADRLRRRAAALLTARGAKVPRQRNRTGLLTTAELSISRLVQQGMRNKEIAAVLHYSPRTVEVYLSRIYTKLSVSSRLELARALDARALDQG
jgi:DNA-binding CsgD family transcriptional regulator